MDSQSSQPSISNSKNSKNTKSSKTNDGGGFIDWITQYDSLVIFGGLFGLIFLTVLYTGLFQAGSIIRKNVLFNGAMAILMAFSFIWVIFNFMGAKISIFGKSFDIGMVIYISVVIFVMFILGN
jgi:hypothetical protein